jgi:hypothetical protein
LLVSLLKTTRLPELTRYRKLSELDSPGSQSQSHRSKHSLPDIPRPARIRCYWNCDAQSPQSSIRGPRLKSLIRMNR